MDFIAVAGVGHTVRQADRRAADGRPAAPGVEALFSVGVVDARPCFVILLPVRVAVVSAALYAKFHISIYGERVRQGVVSHLRPSGVSGLVDGKISRCG